MYTRLFRSVINVKTKKKWLIEMNYRVYSFRSVSCCTKWLSIPQSCFVYLVLPSFVSFPLQRIPVVYFEKEEFPEIEAFMHEVSDTYGFAFQRYAVSYKDGMQDLVDSHAIEVRYG